MTANKSPAEAVAEARGVLFNSICAWASCDSSERLRDGGHFLDGPLDAFAAAVRAEAFEEVRAEALSHIGSAYKCDDDYSRAMVSTANAIADWAKQQAEKARTK